MVLILQDFVILYKSTLNTRSTETQSPTPPPPDGQGHGVYITAINIRGTILSQWIIFEELLNQMPWYSLKNLSKLNFFNQTSRNKSGYWFVKSSDIIPHTELPFNKNWQLKFLSARINISTINLAYLFSTAAKVSLVEYELHI